ncbi:ATP-binding protein [Candidatus Pelagibacter sp.]|nr:ATP-binding protein [Candidatus Pelagibacter sp.]|tara:strand:+ start:10 stop:450 length:441 start_codon:yes stop_codon:yes gene_type:complete
MNETIKSENKISETREFIVNSASLKEVRSFSREVFEKIKIDQDLKDELVLAIAEAAQNIVKHAYKDIETNNDKMEIKISLGKNDELEIGFFDKGKPVDGAKVRHRNIDDVKPGGLGTFFIQQIMDAVVFREGEKPWINHLILTKQL